jgi:hypothetical protein
MCFFICSNCLNVAEKSLNLYKNFSVGSISDPDTVESRIERKRNVAFPQQQCCLADPVDPQLICLLDPDLYLYYLSKIQRNFKSKEKVQHFIGVHVYYPLTIYFFQWPPKMSGCSIRVLLYHFFHRLFFFIISNAFLTVVVFR